MSRPLIKLKKRPSKPKRGTVTKSTDIYDTTTLAQIMYELGCDDPAQVKIDIHWHWDSADIEATYVRDETDEEYAAVTAAYMARKNAYDAWYKDNKELVDAEMERRRQELVGRRDRKIAAERARLEKELKELEKQAPRLAKT